MSNQSISNFENINHLELLSKPSCDITFNIENIYMARIHNHDRMCFSIPDFFNEGSKPHLMLQFNFSRTMKLQ